MNCIYEPARKLMIICRWNDNNLYRHVCISLAHNLEFLLLKRFTEYRTNQFCDTQSGIPLTLKSEFANALRPTYKKGISDYLHVIR